mgnify:CR=1 FL=1
MTCLDAPHLKTGDDYRESLRRYSPEVYVRGRRVESVADEPLFAPGINAVALTYDDGRLVRGATRGDGAVVISRATCNNGLACDADRRPLTPGWTYETWARQRAAIRTLSFDVWKAGVTDRDNPDLWRQLDVQMRYRFGTTGAFEQQDPLREAEEIRLNASAVVDLSHAFLPTMLDAKHGAIINIASSAAFQPMPYFAVYAATKAFVYSFSDALNEEVRARGVHVMAVCPGPVDTAFFEATGAHNLRKKVPKGTMVSAQYIVDASLSGLNSRSRVVVPGGMTKLGAFASAITPRGMLMRVVGKIMRG